jgi:cytosine/adenosine deaminase-related metal-dependent hydrolase
MSEIVIRGGTIVTIDDAMSIASGDVACRDGEIVQVGGAYTPTGRDYEVLDASGAIVMPGLVQSHVHTVQTLARGKADHLELLDWLQKVVWPYEAALKREDIAAAAELACLELIRGGTTTILDMATVKHTEAVFQSVHDAGLRAAIGKAMMDENDPLIPKELRESTKESLAEAAELCREWHGRANDRLRYAYAPRFVLSCTDKLLEAVAENARQANARIHTHASENQAEIAEVRKRKGKDNVAYLNTVGLSGADVCLAHCVWLSPDEITLMAETGTRLLHCPSSNLKLGSGIAHVPEVIKRGVHVSIGADGAPCNNNLDGFLEMRLAGMIHRPRAGVRSLLARDVVRMATRGGAEALGWADRIGSLEVGKRADIICIDIDTPHVAPVTEPYSALAFCARAQDVRHVVVDGHVLLREREPLTLDKSATIARAHERSRQVFQRLPAIL